MVKVLDVPHAASVEANIDDDGNVHLILNDEKGEAFAGVVFTIKGAIDTIDNIGGLIDDYVEKHDSIGPCIGMA